MTDPAILPVDSFREAAPILRRPFTPAAVRFKVQATFGPKEAPTGGLIVAYIDARLVVERLNLVCPHLWHDDYNKPEGKFLLCRLTVDGISRYDVGEGAGKALYSDALKRAGVKFGVGVSLYAIPKMILNKSDGHLKDRRTREGLTLELTPAGESKVRSIYSTWLEQHGIKAFGEPLDHGDSEGATGDPDEPSVVPDEPAAPPARAAARQPAAKPAASEVISAEQRRDVLLKANEVGVDSAGLANVIKAVVGQEPALFESEDEARGWVNRNLEKLPARFVAPLMASLASRPKAAA